jgi:hypothetical protein
MPEHPDVDAVLALHGIIPGPNGFSWADLVGLAQARGWHAGAEEVPRPTPWTRYRAIVWRPSDPRFRGKATLTARGRGLTEEQALAAALASALARWGHLTEPGFEPAA